jgi:hypothetical protein
VLETLDNKVELCRYLRANKADGGGEAQSAGKGGAAVPRANVPITFICLQELDAYVAAKSAAQAAETTVGGSESSGGGGGAGAGAGAGASASAGRDGGDTGRVELAGQVADGPPLFFLKTSMMEAATGVRCFFNPAEVAATVKEEDMLVGEPVQMFRTGFVKSRRSRVARAFSPVSQPEHVDWALLVALEQHVAARARDFSRYFGSRHLLTCSVARAHVCMCLVVLPCVCVHVPIYFASEPGT